MAARETRTRRRMSAGRAADKERYHPAACFGPAAALLVASLFPFPGQAAAAGGDGVGGEDPAGNAARGAPDCNQDGIPDSWEVPGRSVEMMAQKRYAVGDLALDLLAADLNSDGLPDLVTANSALFSGGLDLSVLLAKGDGTFAAMRTAMEPSTSPTRSSA